MIIVKNLVKNYKLGKLDLNILKGISFEINSGEFTIISGPSGSGKSTVLHQLGLLDIPTSGSIIINNKDLSKLNENQRTQFRLNELGYIFQDYSIVPELSALENVMLPGLSSSNHSNPEELLSIVNLKDRMNHLPNELSGGQQQRVAIARSLINNPKIIFADEPCANLDSKSSKEVIELLKKINIEKSTTILMVTHEEWHKSYADKIIYLKDGLIEKVHYNDEMTKLIDTAKYHIQKNEKNYATHVYENIRAMYASTKSYTRYNSVIIKLYEDIQAMNS